MSPRVADRLNRYLSAGTSTHAHRANTANANAQEAEKTFWLSARAAAAFIARTRRGGEAVGGGGVSLCVGVVGEDTLEGTVVREGESQGSAAPVLGKDTNETKPRRPIAGSPDRKFGDKAPCGSPLFENRRRPLDFCPAGNPCGWARAESNSEKAHQNSPILKTCTQNTRDTWFRATGNTPDSPYQHRPIWAFQ